MDQWMAAFKQIFGMTPTKSDCSMASSSIRATLPMTPDKQIKQKPASVGRKRKHLALKRDETKDEEFSSSLKRQRTAKLEEEAVPEALCSSLSLLRRPTTDPFLSPVKNWHHFLASPSKSAKKLEQRMLQLQMSPSSVLLKTPSPAKLLNRAITCTNIGHLLTPEKPAKSSLEEEAEEDDEEEEAMEEEEERAEEVEEEATKTRKKPAKKPRKPKAPKANFVALNLRRRQYAPISKFRGAKRWRGKGKEGEWARGGRRGLLFGGR